MTRPDPYDALQALFDERELHTLRCALELARDRYGEFANECATLPPTMRRVADQFAQQATDVQVLLDHLNQIEEDHEAEQEDAR